MGGSITMPVWAFAILAAAFILSVSRFVLFPLWVRFWDARSRHTVEEIDPRLQLHLSPFTLTGRRVLADRLASDEAVESAIAKISRQRDQSVDALRRECRRMAWDIVPGFNPYFYFRIGYRLARSVLRALYRVRITFEDEDSMAEVSDRAAVVFIINHRSNIDYVVANYLTAERTMLSFGVGEWSRMWPVQSLMRMAGGYFIRRDSRDPLYRLLLKRYAQMATAARVPHAIFLEGQLSPDGGVGRPRLGLLSYITDNFDPASTPELVFVPVGINYDHIFEDENMVRFSSAQFSQKGRLFVAWNLFGFLARMPLALVRKQRNHGYVCAAFGRPVLFGDWLRQREVDWPALDRDERHGWIQALGDHLIAAIGRIVPATPVPVLCALWNGDPTLVLKPEDLEARFRDITDELFQAGCHVVSANGGTEDSLRHALDIAVRRELILRDESGAYRVSPDNGALVEYYANSIRQFVS